MTKETQSESSRVYEVGYHIIPNADASNVEEVANTIREIITKTGGNLIAEGAPQEVRLAYTMFINNQGKNTSYDRAFFGWIKFELEGGMVADIEAALKINRNILRSIVFKTVREETRASVRSGMLREVRRGDTLKSAKREEENIAEEVSEEKLEEALEDITSEE